MGALAVHRDLPRHDLILVPKFPPRIQGVAAFGNRPSFSISHSVERANGTIPSTCFSVSMLRARGFINDAGFRLEQAELLKQDNEEATLLWIAARKP